jgi:cytochrome P450
MLSSSLPSNPKTPPYPLIGHVPYLLRDTLEFFLDLGLGRDLSVYHFGRAPRYLVNHPDLLREIWQDARFERTPETRKVLSAVAGAGLLSQEGVTHRRQRRMIQPAFHRERLAGYFETMVDHANRALERWRGHSRLEVGAEMKRLALDIVTGSLFRQERIEDVRGIVEPLERLLPKLDSDILWHGMLPQRVPVWFLGRERDDVTAIRTGLQRLIQARRAGRPSEPPDLLDLLLETRDEDGSVLSDDDIAAQSLTLISAGFETTANTLTWMWWLLASHPDALERVRRELREVLGNRTPTLEDLPKLRVVDATIKETQRLYPAAWLSSRIATEDVTLDGREFPKGSIFLMSPYVTHRDPRYFLNPLEFNPERFADDSSIPKFAYLPFGAGVHQCIGNIFALWEMKVILAIVASRVLLEPDAGFEPRMKIAITVGMDPFPVSLRWLE